MLDTAWSPFDDSIVASAGEDGKVCVFKVADDDFALWGDDKWTPRDWEPETKINAGGRKAGQLLFHPTASNVLAVASGDHIVRVFDIENSGGGPKISLDAHDETIQGLTWNQTGTLLATVRHLAVANYASSSQKLIPSLPCLASRPRATKSCASSTRALALPLSASPTVTPASRARVSSGSEATTVSRRLACVPSLSYPLGVVQAGALTRADLARSAPIVVQPAVRAPGQGLGDWRPDRSQELDDRSVVGRSHAVLQRRQLDLLCRR